MIFRVPAYVLKSDGRTRNLRKFSCEGYISLGSIFNRAHLPTVAYFMKIIQPTEPFFVALYFPSSLRDI
ncbi:MAG: hypothetical protein U1E78_05245 [Gammaproteobacteria bacterium]